MIDAVTPTEIREALAMSRNALMDAVHEFRDLRRRNEVLQAKADVVEVFRMALGQGVPNVLGYAPDPVFDWERKIARIHEILSALIGNGGKPAAEAPDEEESHDEH